MTGPLIVRAGLGGDRTVLQQSTTISQARLSRQHRSTPSLLDQRLTALGEVDLLSGPRSLPGSPVSVQRRMVLLIADSMGEVFDQGDSLIMPVVKAAYTAERVVQDVTSDLVNLQYDNIIIWLGSHTIHRTDFTRVVDDFKTLVNVIRARNNNAVIAISTLIPKPRENHQTEQPFANYNALLERVVGSFQSPLEQVYLLTSHKVFLDSQGDIIRPIIDNFHDGFHLNTNGMAKLRNYWIKQLAL